MSFSRISCFGEKKAKLQEINICLSVSKKNKSSKVGKKAVVRETSVAASLEFYDNLLKSPPKSSILDFMSNDFKVEVEVKAKKHDILCDISKNILDNVGNRINNSKICKIKEKNAVTDTGTGTGTLKSEIFKDYIVLPNKCRLGTVYTVYGFT